MTAESIGSFVAATGGSYDGGAAPATYPIVLAFDAMNAFLEAEAIDLFIYRIAIEAGGMASALGGIDGIVFTAGIGERAPVIRAAVCERLAWLGVALDAEANAAGATRISTADSKVEVLVYATDEEAMIARHTHAVLSRETAAACG